jgi:3',5'-cyclic AMP phosphodiesterase CpdA
MKFVKPGSGPVTTTLIHISDFHLCRPGGVPLGRFLNKRLFSYLSWRTRRRNEHRFEILDALMRTVRAAEADMIAVTGDLTQLALPAEFEKARECLQALGPPERVFVVPGNHDALVPLPWAQGLACWADYLSPDENRNGVRVPIEFPTLRIRGPVALIGLSTARPTSPFSAAGSLGQRQLVKLAAILEETSRRNLYRVLLMHHAPLPGMVSFHKRLGDAAAFGAIVKRYGAELILHGHSHHHSRAELDGSGGRIPVLGVSSASATSRHPDRRAAFRSIRIASSSKGWTTFLQDHFFSEALSGFAAPAPGCPLSSQAP